MSTWHPISTVQNRALTGSIPHHVPHAAFRYIYRYYQRKNDVNMAPPFELEVIEAALTMATSKLDASMGSVTQRVALLLSKLPHDINPVNLEELRRVKGALVELEQKADTLR